MKLFLALLFVLVGAAGVKAQVAAGGAFTLKQLNAAPDAAANPNETNAANNGNQGVDSNAANAVNLNQLLAACSAKGEAEAAKSACSNQVFARAFAEQQTRIETQARQIRVKQTQFDALQQQIKQQQATIDALKQLVCASNSQAAVCQENK